MQKLIHSKPKKEGCGWNGKRREDDGIMATAQAASESPTQRASSPATSNPPYPSAARIADSDCFPQYTASLKCLEANQDKSKCQQQFDDYKECKKKEVRRFSPIPLQFLVARHDIRLQQTIYFPLDVPDELKLILLVRKLEGEIERLARLERNKTRSLFG